MLLVGILSGIIMKESSLATFSEVEDAYSL